MKNISLRSSGPLCRTGSLAPDVPWQNRILQLLRRIFALQEALPHSELPTVRYLMQLWEILSEHLETAAHSPELSRPDHRQAKLQLMIQYIHDHYAEELTLDRIAAAASLSKSGALNLFHLGYCHLSGSIPDPVPSFPGGGASFHDAEGRIRHRRRNGLCQLRLFLP